MLYAIWDTTFIFSALHIMSNRFVNTRGITFRQLSQVVCTQTNKTVLKAYFEV